MTVAVISSWLPSSEDNVNGVFVLEHANAIKKFTTKVILIHPFITYENVFFSSFQIKKEEYLGFEVYRYHLKLPKLKIMKWLKNKIFGNNSSVIANTYQKKPNDLHVLDLKEKIFFPFLQLRNRFIISKFYRKMKGTLPPNIDVFHSYVVFPSAILAQKLSEKYKAKFVYTEVASDIQKVHGSKVPGWKKYLYRAYYKITHFADIFICVSQDLLNQFIAMGLKPKNGQVEHTIYDGSLFYAKTYKEAKTINAVFCGILNTDNRKGLKGLLQAVSLIDPEFRNRLKVRVIGYGNGLEMYKDIAQKLGISKNIEFLGKKSLENIALEMQNGDFFIIPSFAEGMPCVLIEAMACGLPVLGSEVGGIPEMVDKKVGYLFDPFNIEQFKEQLLNMLQRYNQFDRTEISQKVKHASYLSYGKRMFEKYQNLIDNHR